MCYVFGPYESLLDRCKTKMKRISLMSWINSTGLTFAGTEDGGCEVTTAGRLDNGTPAYARNRLVEIPIAMMWWETEFAQPMFSFTSNDEYT